MKAKPTVIDLTGVKRMRKPSVARDGRVVFLGRPGDGERRHVAALVPGRQECFPIGAPQVQLFAYRKCPLSPMPYRPPPSLLSTSQANTLFPVWPLENRVLLFSFPFAKGGSQLSLSVNPRFVPRLVLLPRLISVELKETD